LRCGATSAARSALVACLMVMLTTAGCQIVLPFGPPLRGQAYVANRGGSFYAGLRCSADLAMVAAVWADEVDVKQDWPVGDRVVWSASAQVPVSEFFLFKSGQPDVMVLNDLGGVLDPTRGFTVYLMRQDGRIATMGIALSDVPPGSVAATSSYSVMTWEAYKQLPDSDFGCKADWQGR